MRLLSQLSDDEISELTVLYQELESRSLIECLRQTVPRFAEGWFHVHLCATLERFARDVRAKKSPRLMLNVPPRHGKSIVSSVRFPLWFMAENPGSEVITASYGQRLSDKFSRQARNLTNHEYFRQFGTKLDDSHASVQSWALDNGSSYFATSIGGSATGSGASVLILDDPEKDLKAASSKAMQETARDWFEAVATTRLTPGGGILILATRWTTDDLCGYLLEKAGKDEDADQWEVISYPALAMHDEKHRKAGEALHPARYDVAKLQKIRGSLTTGTWMALFQQCPVISGGNLIKDYWFRRAATMPKHFDEVVQSWDLRFSKTHTENDYVVGQVWGRKGKDAYLLDQVRGRFGFTETIERFKELSKQWPQAHKKLVENKANGPALEDVIAKEVPGIDLKNPAGSKVQRALSVQHWFEHGHVYLPDRFLQGEFMSEVIAFPAVKHDDQVDAMVQALQHFESQCVRVSKLEALAKM